MITGVRAMFYTPDSEALRAFLRDKLDLPFTDTGGGADLPGVRGGDRMPPVGQAAPGGLFLLR